MRDIDVYKLLAFWRTVSGLRADAGQPAVFAGGYSLCTASTSSVLAD